MNRKEYRTAKFGSWERSLALDAQVADGGPGRGHPVRLRQDRADAEHPRRPPPDRLADTEGVQDAVVEAVFRAYFVEGRDISRTTVLLDVVAEAGLDRDRAEADLNGDDGLAAIRAAEEQARRVGVQGVPFFLINGNWPCPGRRSRGLPRRLSSKQRITLAGRARGRLQGRAGRRAVMLNGNGTAPKVVVVGGSLGGLFNAIALRSPRLRGRGLREVVRADEGPGCGHRLPAGGRRVPDPVRSRPAGVRRRPRPHPPLPRSGRLGGAGRADAAGDDFVGRTVSKAACRLR